MECLTPPYPFLEVREWHQNFCEQLRFFLRCLLKFVHAKSLQSCPTLCDPVDCSPPGFCVHGVSQARILRWFAFLLQGDLHDPEIEPTTPAFAGGFFTTKPPGKPHSNK